MTYNALHIIHNAIDKGPPKNVFWFSSPAASIALRMSTKIDLPITMLHCPPEDKN